MRLHELQLNTDIRNNPLSVENNPWKEISQKASHAIKALQLGQAIWQRSMMSHPSEKDLSLY